MIKKVVIILFNLLSNIFFAQEISLFNKLKLLNSNKQYRNTIKYWLANKSDTILNKNLVYSEIALAYENLNKEDSAFIFYNKALDGFISQKKESKIAETNLKIYDLLDSQLQINIDKEVFFKNFEIHAKKSNNPTLLAKLSHIYAVRTFTDSNPSIPKKYFYDAIYYHKKSNNKKRVAGTYANIGLLYLNRMNKTDSARYFLNKGLEISSQIGDIDTQWNIQLNIGNSYKADNNYIKAIQIYLKADSLAIKKYPLNKKRLLYHHLQDCYKEINDFKNSYFHLLKHDKIKDSINLTKQNISISKIKEQYDNEKLRADNLEIEAKRIKNGNLLIGSLSLILVGSIFVFLVYKNIKRKQRIAEQEREIQIRKTEKLLKEQELAAIDAMISGQEKERQRLANELHDNLGSTLATVKLHFQHLRHNKDNAKIEHIEELYTKTNALLDEAYQKVRTIAHEKNSGVMANQGLLPAVKKLAKKASNRGKLHIEVQDYGLGERLDNALEISIFRMIQELITNAIKHAEASEIHISLTNHDSLLNIIIEDNGKGFNASVLPKKEGMGLRSIEKRVEHLQGTFEIDSTIEKGTNIIINIPI